MGEGSGIGFRATQKYRIRDTFMSANANNQNVIIDCINLTPAAAFHKNSRRLPNSGMAGRPEIKGVSLDGAKAAGSTDYTVGSGILNYRGKSESHFTTARLNCGEIHRVNVVAIKPSQTTARGITLHG